MKEQWLKLKEWWSNLALRERQALSIGGVVLTVFIVYQFMFMPYLNHISDMRKRIETQQKLLVWMQAADQEIKKKAGHAAKRSESISPVALLSVLQKHIKKSGLEQALTQLKQASNDSVEMHFQKVNFDKLVGMLTTIVKEQNITISQFSATAESTPGIVNADVFFKS